MDGPNVNWKSMQLLQKVQSEQFGSQLLMAGSCGLHMLHKSIKSGFTLWRMEKLLRATSALSIHKAPARRDDYIEVTESSQFPLPFCGH